MLWSTFLAAFAASASATDFFKHNDDGNALLRRQNPEEQYIATVCTPNITNPVPPCTQIISIQEECQPNGTEPLDYIASQECMCNGGFFSNWIGCLNCQYVHGARSLAVSSAFQNIISSASNALCTGTPTAGFAAIFSSISDSAPQVVSGAATMTSDQFPSQSAVSLYYTASGPQGAGAITGSATLATATSSASNMTTSVGASSVSGVSSSAAAAVSSSAPSASAASSSAATSSSSSAASTGLANKFGIAGQIAALAIGAYIL
ncbi:hypothetical protein M433DRAFT_8117 [Acidomyces richmondensis BFW]|nr:hypothetical protein M433DRAFT_8117 [Acidomyces richmondensis BFW]